MSPDRSRHRASRRLRRQFDRIRRSVPSMEAWVTWLQARRARLVRVPLAVVFILGGLLSFLPLLGVWMLPFGLMLLAVDLPVLQGPVSGAIVRLRIKARLLRRRWRRWRGQRR